MIPKILGVLNVTPDSFSDGGQFLSPEAALAKAHQMIREGADLIDVGGESTRPGSLPIALEEERRRVEPVLRALKDLPVSIDTQKPEIAEMALDLGAQMVNDVGGLRDPSMFQLIAERAPNVIVMHMQGRPATMQDNPMYVDVVRDVREELLGTARRLVEAGLPKQKIWLDPGIGFGKNFEHNIALLQHISDLAKSDFPVLIGVSRKGFLGRITGEEDPPSRLAAALAIQCFAQQQGIYAFRTHDVWATRQAALAWSQMQSS
ncbi:MAG: dihydropteroate synthase [Chthonomonas sp.]|nr:dihydropteroate synthase [Chthonomonas sp.]